MSRGKAKGVAHAPRTAQAADLAAPVRRIDPVYHSTVNRRPPKEATMPLSKGKGKKAVSKNVKELMDTYKETGKIGTSKPKSKGKAVKQAVAISLAKAKGPKSKGGKK